MKLKEGDKVRVKSLEWYNKNEDGGIVTFKKGPCFSKPMAEFCGKEATIKRIDGKAYVLDIANFFFAEDSVEPIMQDNNLNVLKGCTLTTNCITLQDGQTAKICTENGKTKIMIEQKEVKEEEPKFKKGDVLSCTEYGKTWTIILNDVDKFDTQYLCMLGCYGGIFHNGVCKTVNWKYATEEEKRTLFIAMLNQGMFWDENKMKVRTLKDGDIVTIKVDNGNDWNSIFKEIKDGEVFSYYDLTDYGYLYNEVGPISYINNIISIRYSTTEERKTLFDKIEKQTHKSWNVETKCLENIRWRAKKGEDYWIIDSEGNVHCTTELNYESDDKAYSFGNYFKTKELAEAAANKIKELLSKL